MAGKILSGKLSKMLKFYTIPQYAYVDALTLYVQLLTFVVFGLLFFLGGGEVAL